MTHHIKLNIMYADAVLSGEKCFEIRYNDRGYQRGDLVKFTPVEDGLAVVHPVAREVFEITYLVHGYGLRGGWCAFGIQKLKREGQADDDL